MPHGHRSAQATASQRRSSLFISRALDRPHKRPSTSSTICYRPSPRDRSGRALHRCPRHPCLTAIEVLKRRHHKATSLHQQSSKHNTHAFTPPSSTMHRSASRKASATKPTPIISGACKLQKKGNPTCKRIAPSVLSMQHPPVAFQCQLCHPCRHGKRMASTTTPTSHHQRSSRHNQTMTNHLGKRIAPSALATQ